MNNKHFYMHICVLVVLLVGLFGTVALATPAPVILLIESGPEASALQRVGEAFTAQTGIPFEIMELGRAVKHQSMPQLLAGGDASFDIIFGSSLIIPELAAGNLIESLEKFIQDPSLTNKTEFDEDDFAVNFTFDGQRYVLPVDVSAHFLYYRADLIPNPPQTWDEYIEVAKQFTQEFNPASPTKYGATFTGLIPNEPPKVYYSMLWTFGGDIANQSREITLDSPEAVAALNVWLELKQAKVFTPEILSTGFSEVVQQLNQGQAAMATPMWNAAYNLMTPPYGDKVALALLPGIRQADGSIYRAPFQQGLVLGINGNSKNQENAWRFIEFATGKVGGRIYAENGGTPSRFSLLRDELLRTIRPDLSAMEATLLEARTVSSDVIRYSAVEEAVASAIAQALTGRSSAADALKQGAQFLRDNDVFAK